MLSNLPIAKCRENYIINTNYFSIPELIILVGGEDQLAIDSFWLPTPPLASASRMSASARAINWKKLWSE